MCGLLGGCAEGIVFEWLVGLRRPLHTVCNDLIGDLLRFGDVCCLRAVSLLECSVRVTCETETNFIFVSFDDSRLVRGGRSDGRSPKIRPIGKCIGTRAIVGLGDSLCLIRPVGLFSQYLKAIGVNAAARDRALAVEGGVDVIISAERIGNVGILDIIGSITCICVLYERCSLRPIAACDTYRGE